MIRLLVGLGNPGPGYENTRHNAGFWWVDAAQRALNTNWVADKNCFGHTARTACNGQTVWLLKPQDFMNVSGKAVAALANFFKIAPQDILVAHDELDIAPGEAKLKFGGSHAGHNGLRDIHAQLGTDQYWRLRLGIGHPGNKADVIHWVLKKPSPDHRIAVDQAIERAIKALPQLLDGDMEQATRLIHTSKPVRPKPPRPGPVLPVATDQQAPSQTQTAL
ncbi:MAG: aminoacyl-tRNA hydrolase [Rhodoferax sp.]